MSFRSAGLRRGSQDRANRRGSRRSLGCAGDILDYVDFFQADEEIVYDEKAFANANRQTKNAVQLLTKFREQLAAIETFNAESAESALRAFVAAEEVKMGQIIHALRVAVTGKAVGFGMFETWRCSGKNTCSRGSISDCTGFERERLSAKIQARSAASVFDSPKRSRLTRVLVVLVVLVNDTPTRLPTDAAPASCFQALADFGRPCRKPWPNSNPRWQQATGFFFAFDALGERRGAHVFGQLNQEGDHVLLLLRRFVDVANE